MFRLRAAGYRGPDLFSRLAIELISKASEGLTRRINILADKALLAAFSEGVHQVDGKQVRAAIRDAQFRRIDGPAGIRWWIGAGAAVTLATIAGLAYLAGSYSAAGQARSESTINAAQTTTAPVVTAPQPATPPVHATSSPTAVFEPSTAPPKVTAPETATVSAAKPLSLDARIAATEQWLKQTPDSHHFIQLLVTDAASHEQVTAFLANNAGTLDLRQVRVYRSSIGGGIRLGVIYGDYPSRDQAKAALATLGEISPSSRPYVRAVARLRSPGAAKGSS